MVIFVEGPVHCITHTEITEHRETLQHSDGGCFQITISNFLLNLHEVSPVKRTTYVNIVKDR